MLKPSKARALFEAALNKRELEKERREAVEREIEATREKKRIFKELEDEGLTKKRQEVKANFPRLYDEIQRKLYERAAEGHFYIRLDLPGSHLLLEEALKKDGLKKTTLDSELIGMNKGHADYWFSYFDSSGSVDKSEMAHLSTHLARWISVPSLFSDEALSFRQAQKVSDVILGAASQSDLEKISTLAKTSRLSLGGLLQSVSKHEYEWPPVVRDMVCAEDPNPTRREFFSLVNKYLEQNRARERQIYAEEESEPEVQFLTLRKKLLLGHRSTRAARSIYYWGHDFSFDDNLNGRLFFLSSIEGQKTLNSIQKLIMAASASGVGWCSIRQDEIFISNIYCSNEENADAAIVKCLNALGFMVGCSQETSPWPLSISW